MTRTTKDPKHTERTRLARYQANPASFIEEVLIDPETARPFVLLKAEKKFLRYAFKRARNGRLLYPEQVYACPKKSGKTTFAAIYMITMVLLFGGPYAEAICAANDHEQSVGRVFEAIKRIIECSPLLRGEAKITANKVTIYGAVITAIANDYAGAAGSNQVMSTFDELWAYTSEGSRRLFDELVPPPTRKIACRLTVTYAGFEGESTLLKELYDRGLRQPEVAPNLYAGDGILMFWSHEPVAPWQDEAWFENMRRSLRPNQYLRMIENRFVTTESSFIDLAAWDACVRPETGAIPSNPSLPVWVGVDASVRRDSSAVVAVTYDKNNSMVRLVFHRIFTPSPTDPINFEDDIEAILLDLKRRFSVRKVLFDPYQMVATSQRLARAGVPVEEFPQTLDRLTAATQQLYELVDGRSLVLYPSEAMRLAVSRCVAVESARGWKISKEKQSHKIDVIIALAMACYAAVRGGGQYTYRLDVFDPNFRDEDLPPAGQQPELAPPQCNDDWWRSMPRSQPTFSANEHLRSLYHSLDFALKSGFFR
jgi:terminase large subunit-like protein